jgi:hypothetical protein
MRLLDKIFGPKSKYEEDIPYTYEARIKIIVGDEFNSFYADTICALVEYLDKKKIEPDGVDIYEIFKDKENKLDRGYCISEDGKWLSCKELCVSFTERYPGHIHKNCCTFDDRERDVLGP